MAFCDPGCPLLMKECDFNILETEKVRESYKILQMTGFLAMLLDEIWADQPFRQSPKDMGVLLLYSCMLTRWSMMKMQNSDWGSRVMPECADFLVFQWIFLVVRKNVNSETVRSIFASVGISRADFGILGVLGAADVVRSPKTSVLFYAADLRETMGKLLLRDDAECFVNAEGDENLKALSSCVFSTDSIAVESLVVEVLSRKEEFEGRLLFCWFVRKLFLLPAV